MHWESLSTTHGPASSPLFGMILVGIGGVAAWAIGREWALLVRMRHEGITATGTVVGHVRPKGWNGVDRPVIRFADQRGQQVEFSPRRALQRRFVPEGEQFSVRYLADAPQRARLANEESRPASLLVFTVISLVLLGLGVLMLTGVPVWRNPHTTRLVAAVGCSLFGLAALGFGACQVRRLRLMRRDGITTTGTVVRHFVSGGDAESRTRKSVIEFFDTNHRRCQLVGDDLPIGATVPVIYYLHHPGQARIDSVSRLVRNTTLFVLVSLVLSASIYLL